mmetsp:Transcript_24421/g.84901  ORF Transcript_24421/g.84901 Transcript_24421/m.84901 type:complete len:269 (+) Transcript_24421:2016-2822(+)
MPLCADRLGPSLRKASEALYWHSPSGDMARWIRPGRPSSMISAWLLNDESRLATARDASRCTSRDVWFMRPIRKWPPWLEATTGCVATSSVMLPNAPHACREHSSSWLCASSTSVCSARELAIGSLFSSARLRLLRHAAVSRSVSSCSLEPATASGSSAPPSTMRRRLAGRSAKRRSALTARHLVLGSCECASSMSGGMAPLRPMRTWFALLAAKLASTNAAYWRRSGSGHSSLVARSMMMPSAPLLCSAVWLLSLAARLASAMSAWR